ncbi:MAG: nitrilase [Sulfurimonas sp.]|nr:MAG: nitrilase [Sulfurimonas sp.]
MTIALAQSMPQLNRSNLKRVLEVIQDNRADVIVFPELALNGYMLQDKVFEDAYALEELHVLKEASRHQDIVIGVAINEAGRTYNSALYFSNGALCHMHHKMHLPNYGMFEEARYFFKGETITCFDTQYGKAAMLICEDLWRASVIATLSELKPDLIYVLAASPSRDFSDTGLGIESQWHALLTSGALLCSAYVIFVNRVGFEDGLGFWGGSRVITAQGVCEHQLKYFDEETVTVPLNHTLHKVEKWMAKID